MSTVYFVDRSLGYYKLPDALEAVGLEVRRHDDIFSQDTPDTTWLREVAARGWIVLSGDKRIIRRPHEVAAIREDARVLLLVGGRVPTLERAHNFINTLPKIQALLATMKPPAVAKVYRPSPTKLVYEGKPGSVKQIWPKP